MDLLLSFLEAVYNLSNAMAIYILVGLLFAGLLHELIPDTLVKEHLGSDNVNSVVKATIFGIPLPVCSCGVIPIATSIKKSGASNGATLSFLISTPITGIDSILATFGMFGWAFTLYRLFTSMIIAMIAGILTNIYKRVEVKPTQPAFSAVAPQDFSVTAPVAKEETSCCSAPTPSAKFSMLKALQYGFITLLGDIAKPLFWGLMLGALITILVPENLSNLVKEYQWISYLIVVAIAVPMYVCATASLPIAAALILSGVSAGAAFVFLTAGPATNTVTIGVVKKMLGSRALAIYLGTIAAGSILFGILLDTLFSWMQIDITQLVHIHEEANFIDMASSLLLWGFILYFFIKTFLPKKESSCCSSESCES